MTDVHPVIRRVQNERVIRDAEMIKEIWGIIKTWNGYGPKYVGHSKHVEYVGDTEIVISLGLLSDKARETFKAEVESKPILTYDFILPLGVDLVDHRFIDSGMALYIVKLERISERREAHEARGKKYRSYLDTRAVIPVTDRGYVVYTIKRDTKAMMNDPSIDTDSLNTVAKLMSEIYDCMKSSPDDQTRKLLVENMRAYLSELCSEGRKDWHDICRNIDPTEKSGNDAAIY